jgi:hypothetical protein
MEFKDPLIVLTGLRTIQIDVASSDLPPEIRNLRTNGLRFAREMRQAALFRLGMAERTNRKILFSCIESQDYDFVTTWSDEEGQHFSPVQLKEVVSRNLNPEATIRDVIQGLSRYNNPTLTVAIHHSQAGKLDPAKIQVPKLQIASLWIFASISEDQSEWGLWGDLMSSPYGSRFHHPS